MLVDLPINGSGMAWLCVVLIQAIIHFCFIGPRNKSRRKVEEHPFLDETSSAVAVEEQVLVLAANLGSTNLENEIPCLGDHDVLSTFLCSTDSTPLSDQDECDSRPTEAAALPLNEAGSRCNLSPRGRHKFYCPSSDNNASPSAHVVSGFVSDDDDESRASMSQRNREENECLRTPSFAPDYNDHLEDDDYDADSYFEDEDDQWRYKLAQDYYSHGSPSLVKMARSSGLCSGADPAFEPILKHTANRACLSLDANQLLLASNGVLLTHPVKFSRTGDDFQEAGENMRRKRVLFAVATPIQCA